MIAALVLAAATVLTAPAPGRLVIVGGGLSPDNAAIHEAFLERLPADGVIAIVPAASGEPARSAASFARTLEQRYGVAAARIEIVRLAVRDDPSTPEDESVWAAGAETPAEIAKIARADAIWMTGGDQARLLQTLVRPDGAETTMLAAIRARLAAGATLGGTSAGAAVMSDPMIGGGDGLTALLDDPTSQRVGDGRLQLTRGLGFAPGMIVDQHFGERARLGRLVRATAVQPQAQRLGFGVDEDTALVIDLAAQRATAIGRGTITVIDARDASFTPPGRAFAGENVQLSVLSSGDAVDLATLTIAPLATRTPISAAEDDARADSGGGGMAVAAPRLDDLLGGDLLDNAGADRLERVSFDGQGRGVRFVFTEDADARAYYGDGYTIVSVAFAIEPVRIAIRSRR